jgi:hypothetical protein
MSAGFEVVLRGGVDAPGLARRAVAANDPALPPSVQGDIALQAGRIRVEVVDPGTGFEPPAPPAKGASGGWGLFLVDQPAGLPA